MKQVGWRNFEGWRLGTPSWEGWKSDTIYWTPAQIETGKWLDASCLSQIMLNGNDVTQWGDLSGNGGHAVQGVAGQRPQLLKNGQNGLPTIEFPGSRWFDTDLDFLGGGVFPTDHTAFIVTRKDNSTNIYGAANGSNGANSLHIGFNGGNYRVNYWGNDYGTGITANFLAGQYNNVRFNWSDSTNLKSVHANSVLEGQGPGSGGGAGTIGTMSGGGRIGNVVGQGIYDGGIAEIVFVLGTMLQETIDKMDGYLAWKWGLALPVGHPYENGAPLA